MSGYKIVKGEDAVKDAMAERPQYEKIFKSLSGGKTYKVRALGMNEVVKVMVHSVYETFTSTPCTEEDLYDKAVALLRADQKALKDKGDENGAEALGKLARALSAKERYLIGFVDLADGKPFVVDLSKKQAQGVISTMEQYKKRLNQLAFSLGKTGTGQSTVLNFNPILFLEEDLKPEELKNFKESEGTVIDAEVYSNCMYVKSFAEQADDIFAFERKHKGLRLAERLGLNKQQEADVQPVDAEEEGNYGF